MSLPVTSFVTLSGRDETNKVWVSPGPRAEPPPPAEQAIPLCGTDAVEISSLPLKGKLRMRAQVRTCFVGSARVAPSRPVREAPYRSRNGNKMVRSDKSHIVRHKIGCWEKQRAAPARGTPRDPVPGIL